MTTFIKHIAVGGWSSGRCGGEMGSPDSNLEQGYFVVFLGKVIFFSQCPVSHPARSNSTLDCYIVVT